MVNGLAINIHVLGHLRQYREMASTDIGIPVSSKGHLPDLALTGLKIESWRIKATRLVEFILNRDAMLMLRVGRETKKNQRLL